VIISHWIELRARGKMFGRLSADGLVLEFRERDLIVRFDLIATVIEQEATIAPFDPGLLADEQERCRQIH